MQTLTAPVKIYVDGLTDGRLMILVSSQSYVIYWLIFLVLGALAYALAARGLFGRATSSGLSVSHSSSIAQVGGLFAMVVAFYLVFFFSPARATAWFAEVTFLWIWFVYFLFNYLTAQ